MRKFCPVMGAGLSSKDMLRSQLLSLSFMVTTEHQHLFQDSALSKCLLTDLLPSHRFEDLRLLETVIAIKNGYHFKKSGSFSFVLVRL